MPNILVVDDNPVDRKLISRLLERDPGWKILPAKDGKEALEIIETQPGVDLVVTDLQMPNVDGLELVKEIRRRFNNIPVVLVTAFGSENISLKALQAGAANYSHKSRLSVDLNPTVRNVLKMSHQLQRAETGADYTSSQRLAFVLDNNVGQIAHLIESFSHHLPEWANDDKLRISMALDEALTNAICHGNLELNSEWKENEAESKFYNELQVRQDAEPFRARRVRVQAEFTDEQIRFCIQDEGPGFDPENVADPTCPENIFKPSGRGLLLIRSFMDEVIHNVEGNEITLVKRRPDQSN